MESRTETRTRFDEKEGWIVEEFDIATPLAPGQTRQSPAPREPAIPVVVTVADVSLDLARQVIEQNGLVAVPASYLTPEQLQELNITPPAPDADVTEQHSANLAAKEVIAKIKVAANFDELNALVGNDTRATVLAAAEARAAELKQGA